MCNKSVLTILFLAVNTGCTTKQYLYFEGTCSHRQPKCESSFIKQQIGVAFGDRGEPGNTGVEVVDVPGSGNFVFLYDKQKFVSDQCRLSNASLRQTWFAPDGSAMDIDMPAFVRSTEQERQRARGIYPMQGKVDIEKWDGNANFRVRLAAEASDPRRTGFDGILTIYSQGEWHPLKAFGLLLWSLGLVQTS
jgi:hypothetical protein